MLVTNNRLQVEITERQNTEAALVQAQKLQAVGQLAGGIAHDFNNLLATIQGNLDLLAQTVPLEQERQHHWIDRATGAVHRGSQLSGRLLAFSRRQRLSVDTTEVNRLISDLVPLLRTSTHGQRIRIETSLSGDLWPAMIEPSQVEAAILNLALNARDAMPDGGRLTISTTNHTLQEKEEIAAGHYVAITVTDTGTGMDEHVARRAFEPFFTTKGPSGTGPWVEPGATHGPRGQRCGPTFLIAKRGYLGNPASAESHCDTRNQRARQLVHGGCVPTPRSW